MAFNFKSNLYLSMTNIYFFCFLVGFYPAIFFISNNWFAIGLKQSLYLIVILPLFSLAILSTVFHLFANIPVPLKIRRAGTIKIAKIHFSVVELLTIVFATYILSGLLDFTLSEFQKSFEEISLRKTIVFSVLGLAVWRAALLPQLLIERKMGLQQGENLLIRPLNRMLMLLTAVSLLSLCYSLSMNFDKLNFKIETADQNTIEIYENLKFQSTPNIYLIVPDSYPSNKVLRELFDFDNHLFTKDLTDFGFTVYENYFSSYPYSVESMHSMFTMTHNFFQNSIGKDGIGLKEVVAGKNNPVMNILKNNGYELNYIHDTNYLLSKGCFVDNCYPLFSEKNNLIDNLQNFYFFNFSNYKQNPNSAMKSQIQSNSAKDKVFVYRHSMTVHSEIKSYEKVYSDKVADFRNAYPDRIVKENAHLVKEIGQIVESDPNAIVILVADHGTWGGAVRTANGTTADETRDKLNVFLAIKWGENYQGAYDKEITTSVNLFRYIFSHLSNNDNLLSTKQEDDGFISLNGKWRVVKNGAVLTEPEALVLDN